MSSEYKADTFFINQNNFTMINKLLPKGFWAIIVLAVSMISFAAQPALAQERVSGVVKGGDGAPIIGATVIEKGTTRGTTTDIDGKFTLAGVSKESTLVFSMLGYASQEFTVGSQSFFEVTLEEDAVQMEDVVVIGYGTLDKKELSSSIVHISKEDFQKGAMSNPMEMLTGKVAGLNVVNTSLANPNAGSNLQIRGATSLSVDNSPLIVIDGMIGGDIRNLSSQDIESMTVLKDGASAAIYGTRGANGVILITTKQGSGAPGKATVTYDSWFGVNFAKDKPDVLTPEEFRRSLRGNDYGSLTNWYDEILRDFSYDNNQYLSLDGSSAKGTNYNVSLNYKQATGLDLASARKEYGGRFAVNQKALNGILEFGTSLSARKVNEEWGDEGQFDNALTLNPTMPVYNEDGSFYHPRTTTGARNPVEQLVSNKNGGERIYLLGTAHLKGRIFMDNNHLLTTELNYSLQYNDLNQHYFTPSTSAESEQNGYAGRAELRYSKWWTSQVEWLANYSLNYGDHALKMVAGYSFSQDDYEAHGLSNNDFQYDSFLWHNIGAGSYMKDGRAGMWSSKTRARLIGLFARANYDWNGILMASASLRYEGSTKFGKNNKWGYFPAASAAWEIANMDFMQEHSDIVNSLKLRVSYGVTGRSGFSPYQSLSTYGSNSTHKGSSFYLMDGSWVGGYGPTKNANPELGWERSVDFNVGVDFALFGNRLRGSIEYFDRQSRDLLYTYTAPQPPMIYSTILVNVGTTTNRGVELSISGEPVQTKNFSWTTGINYSFGKTELTKLSSDVYKADYLQLYLKPGVGTTEYLFRVVEGGTVGEFYGYEHAGVDENGELLVYNKDNQPVSKSVAGESDKRYIGNGAPTSYLSWSNTFRYKGWDLDIFCRGAFGFDVFNMRRYGMGLKGSGTDNVLRAAYTDYAHINSDGGILSSFYLERGDFFKIENITLGYNFRFRESSLVDNLRLFISAKNIYTFTGYSGNDPSIIMVNGLTPGVDSASAYPSALQISVGASIRFN